MYPIYQTEGIVLNKRSVGEAHVLVSVLTEELGLVRPRRGDVLGVTLRVTDHRRTGAHWRQNPQASSLPGVGHADQRSIFDHRCPASMASLAGSQPRPLLRLRQPRQSPSA